MSALQVLLAHAIFAAWLWRRRRVKHAYQYDEGAFSTELAFEEARQDAPLLPCSRVAARPPPPTHPHAAAIAALQSAPPPLRAPAAPPAPLEACTWEWVDRPERLAQLAAQLSRCERFALDAEHHSAHSYAGITCLLQLSTGAADYLVDCLALGRAGMAPLVPVLASPAVCKVGPARRRGPPPPPAVGTGAL